MSQGHRALRGGRGALPSCPQQPLRAGSQCRRGPRKAPRPPGGPLPGICRRRLAGYVRPASPGCAPGGGRRSILQVRKQRRRATPTDAELPRRRVPAQPRADGPLVPVGPPPSGCQTQSSQKQATCSVCPNPNPGGSSSPFPRPPAWHPPRLLSQRPLAVPSCPQLSSMPGPARAVQLRVPVPPLEGCPACPPSCFRLGPIAWRVLLPPLPQTGFRPCCGGVGTGVERGLVQGTRGTGLFSKGRVLGVSARPVSSWRPEPVFVRHSAPLFHPKTSTSRALCARLTDEGPGVLRGRGAPSLSGPAAGVGSEPGGLTLARPFPAGSTRTSSRCSATSPTHASPSPRARRTPTSSTTSLTSRTTGEAPAHPAPAPGPPPLTGVCPAGD